MANEIEKIANIDEVRLITDKVAFGGVSSLDDIQLVALLLGRGEVKRANIDKAHQLMERYESLDNLFATLPSNLPSRGSTVLKAAFELSSRLTHGKGEIDKISSPEDAKEIAKGILAGAVGEEFWVISLNTALHVTEKRCLSKGGMTNSVVDIKILMRMLINNLSTAIILAHNHPSGNLTPSREDIQLTKKIKEAARLFDIKVLDHIIVGHNDTFSFAEGDVL